MKKIFLIDCPGIVPPSSKDSSEDILFRGVVRVEHVTHAEQYIPGVLKRCKRQHLERTYEISGWNNATEFIEILARKQGRLLKGGEPDEQGIAKQVINDFNRGKIPWFVPPPEDENRPRKKLPVEGEEEEEEEEVEEEIAAEEDEQKSVSKGNTEEEWKGIQD